MKMPAKIAAIVVICAMLLGFQLAAYAAEPAPIFSVDQSYSAHPGEEFTVDISANSSRGFCAGEFTLGYDPTVLTPTSLEKGEDGGKYFVGNKDYAASKIYFAIIDSELVKTAGTIATVTFKVNDNVVLYNGELDLNVSNLVGNISVGYGLNNVSSTTVDGNVSVTRRISVPAVANPTDIEELFISGTRADMVLSGTSWANLAQQNIADNFSANASTRFFAHDGVTELGSEQLLTTGCKIKLFENEALVDTMTVSVKGDVNGDYIKDGYDAFLAGMIESGMLTEDDIDSANISAADANRDGSVDSEDFSAAEANGLLPN